MCGLGSEATQKRLLTESTLTLDKAVEIAVSMELASREAHHLSASGKLHKVSTGDQGAGNKCYRCDKTGHFADECWSKDVDCRKCGKKGHLACACKSKGADNKTRPTFKKRQAVYSVEPRRNPTEANSSSDEASVYVLAVQGGTDGYWETPLLDRKPVRMEIDTGAAVSIVSYVVCRVPCTQQTPVVTTNQHQTENLYRRVSANKRRCKCHSPGEGPDSS